MNANARIPVGLPESATPFQRVQFMLGHYDFRVFIRDTAYVDIGAGSLGLIRKLGTAPIDYHGCLGSIGRFCEFNETAKIVVYGDHDNDRTVNITFSGVPLLKGRNEQALKPYTPFRIGNGVVASANSLILPGRSIGDGVVIGAGAVVTRDLEPYGIYAGAPANLLRYRSSGVAWWDFSVAYLLDNIGQIEAVATSPTQVHSYRRKSPAFVLKLGDELELLGILDGDKVSGFSTLPQAVREYVVQAMTSPNPYWLADCWTS